MSWDSYIDVLLQNSLDEQNVYHIDKVCILGREGGKWTSDEHQNALKILPDEVDAIVRAFETKDFSDFQTNGVKCEGQTYKFLRNEEDLLLAKQKDEGALVVQRSKTAIVIAHMPEGKQQGKTNYAVAKIVDYLISLDM
ncbi:profilin-like [Symsagittifera roscoffensis]|uniref:profilin-like n=1 Tax=Symsagittifera roscoffensis TaxID=84072 RepID=UPI00307C553D